MRNLSDYTKFVRDLREKNEAKSAFLVAAKKRNIKTYKVISREKHLEMAIKRLTDFIDYKCDFQNGKCKYVRGKSKKN